MFDELFHRLEAQGKPATTENVFAILDADPDLAQINGGLTLKYQTDASLIEALNRATRITASPAGEA
jgi:hypothetical protein